jgi:hypothetical protein
VVPTQAQGMYFYGNHCFSAKANQKDDGFKRLRQQFTILVKTKTIMTKWLGKMVWSCLQEVLRILLYVHYLKQLRCPLPIVREAKPGRFYQESHFFFSSPSTAKKET